MLSSKVEYNIGAITEQRVEAPPVHLSRWPPYWANRPLQMVVKRGGGPEALHWRTCLQGL